MNKKQIMSLLVAVALITLAFYGLLAEQILGYYTGFRWCYNLLVGITALSVFNYAVMFICKGSTISQRLIKSYRDGEHLPLATDMVFYGIMVFICAMSESYYIMAGWAIIGGYDRGFRMIAEEEKGEPKHIAELMADADKAIQCAERKNAELYAELVRIAIKIGLTAKHNPEHERHDHYMELAFRIQAKLDNDYQSCDACNARVPTESVTFTSKNTSQALCQRCVRSDDKPDGQEKSSN